ncbi:MAG: hypothetical protein CMJ58_14210 [Planctomycetaceae bacterium]|nr:hypothetical protein [Planctomycetaceae bacterium]
MSEPAGLKPSSRDKRRRNALTHGMRATTLAGLPKGAAYIRRLVLSFRRELEAVVIDAKGEVSFMDGAHINTASRHEQVALLAGRWLKLNAETMSHQERLQYLQAVARASEARDRALSALNLDRDTGSILESLYSTPRPAVHDAEPED